MKMAEPAGGCLPPALLCVFRPGQTGCHVFPEALLHIPLKPSGVVFKMTDQIRQTASAPPPPVHPRHVQQENLASIIIAPLGELPKFLPSSFVRNEALVSCDWLKYVF